MSQLPPMWQTTTAPFFSQLYAGVWQYLDTWIGSATALDMIALSVGELHDIYPFLSRVKWAAEGPNPASLEAAMADAEKAHVQAGCERFLQDIQHLVETCAGPLVAQGLQTATEQLRYTLDPLGSSPVLESDTQLSEPSHAVLPALHSMAQQSFELYRQLHSQQTQYEPTKTKLESVPNEAPRIPSLPADVLSTPADLARSETFYHDLFDLSPDGVLVTNTKGDIIKANYQCAEVLELDTPAELVGRNVAEFLVYPEERESFLERISQSHRIEGQLRELRTQSGRTIVIVYSSRLIDYEGYPCLLSVVRDVTERARLRQEMEDFAYSASHDLQAPLRTFEGYARWLLEDYGEALDEMGRQLCEEIIDDALHMKKLLDGLLEYSRIGRQHTEAVAVDVAQVLEWVQHDLQIEIGDTGAQIRLPDTLPTVFYPEVRLTQIFSNLLSNALKFIPAGRPPHIEIEWEPLDRHFRFTVRDNGIGIAAEHFSRIFEIFKRLHTREDYPGTGAGLTIVKKIVESHGGQIGLESEPGSGSAFWFTIPKTEEPQ